MTANFLKKRVTIAPIAPIRDLMMAGTQQSVELKLALDQEQQKSKKLEESMKKLDEEMKRTDELLYQMIPKLVADRLRNGENPIDTCQVTTRFIFSSRASLVIRRLARLRNNYKTVAWATLASLEPRRFVFHRFSATVARHLFCSFSLRLYWNPGSEHCARTGATSTKLMRIADELCCSYQLAASHEDIVNSNGVVN